jgi:hypothetical protein
MDSVLRKNITDEIQEELRISKLYGFGFSSYLIEPLLETYHKALNKEISERYWTILIERENRKTLFFIEEDNLFGLGSIGSSNELIDLGYYGTLAELLLFIH